MLRFPHRFVIMCVLSLSISLCSNSISQEIGASENLKQISPQAAKEELRRKIKTGSLDDYIRECQRWKLSDSRSVAAKASSYLVVLELMRDSPHEYRIEKHSAVALLVDFRWVNENCFLRVNVDGRLVTIPTKGLSMFLVSGADQTYKIRMLPKVRDFLLSAETLYKNGKEAEKERELLRQEEAEKKRVEAERVRDEVEKWEDFKASAEFASLEAASEAAKSSFIANVVQAIPTRPSQVAPANRRLVQAIVVQAMVVAEAPTMWNLGKMTARDPEFREFCWICRTGEFQFIAAWGATYGDMMWYNDDKREYVLWKDLWRPFLEEATKVLAIKHGQR